VRVTAATVMLHIKSIERSVESIHYVGDLDHAGLDIAWSARRCAKELGLPDVAPASELHRQMLLAAKSFGHPQGWPAQERFADADRDRILDLLPPDVRGQVNAVLKAGRRIPEEILGPDELRSAWAP
jgi:hypothetical protein